MPMLQYLSCNSSCVYGRSSNSNAKGNSKPNEIKSICHSDFLGDHETNIPSISF